MALSTQEQALGDDGYVVSFKGDFLDQLIDARALLEVASKIIVHHDDIKLDKQAFMGLSLVIEQVKGLMDIDAHLLPANSVILKGQCLCSARKR